MYKIILSLILASFVSMSLAYTNPHMFHIEGDAEVYFSPSGGATDSVVREINNARRVILVQAYSFTSKPIAGALVKAFKRGVNVEVVLDKSQKKERYTSATFVANIGIPTYIDNKHAIAHNKVMIIDEYR